MIKIKTTTPRFKKKRNRVVWDNPLVFELASTIAEESSYAAGSNYTLARNGKVLDPEARVASVIIDGDKLELVIRYG